MRLKTLPNIDESEDMYDYICCVVGIQTSQRIQLGKLCII